MAACSTAAGPDLVVPTTGRYVETVFAPSTLTTYPDVIYSTRPNAGRQYTSQRTEQVERTQPTLTLRMDIAVPPNATADARQPLLVLIHGGGFVAGDKSDFYPEMATYARAGYVVATINYRLTPGNGASDTIRTTAVLHAVEDAQNAIRFLRRNAARYGIDPTRVVSIGSSAGGGVSLTLAIQPDDPRASSDAPGTSARVDGAVSTGATLQGESDAVLSLLSFEASDSPVLLYHAKETDSGTGATWTNSVLPTQRRIIDSGNACTVVAQPDMTHTVDLSIGNEYWPSLRDFLYTRLRLASLR
jgi:poly(3-hydroxybutyrate) depolymerase